MFIWLACQMDVLVAITVNQNSWHQITSLWDLIGLLVHWPAVPPSPADPQSLSTSTCPEPSSGGFKLVGANPYNCNCYQLLKTKIHIVANKTCQFWANITKFLIFKKWLKPQFKNNPMYSCGCVHRFDDYFPFGAAVWTMYFMRLFFLWQWANRKCWKSRIAAMKMILVGLYVILNGSCWSIASLQIFNTMAIHNTLRNQLLWYMSSIIIYSIYIIYCKMATQ